ncbi:response regulator [Paenibacillus abyssi]|uniref:DNA-binding response regulator n=1 Tax=Paenibacillus abyssi TaxID=1340531 RepID=A0A917FWE2_9BACL|nr:response regulator [Paenibacillus abyssi]GGG07978.1 hypothetical protein GCM10010916_26060 [Paenibacillus abyssi]
MYKVIVVDDEPLFRDYLRNKMAWSNYGFEVCCEARNGQEALEEAERHKPHLALIDINMPFMDGMELAERLKARFESMVIVFVTGHNEFEYVQKAVRIGVHDYLLKPFNRTELASMLERIRPSLPPLPQHETENGGSENAFPDREAPSYDAAAIHESILQALRMNDDVPDEIKSAFRLLRHHELRGEYAYTMLMGLVSLAISYASERGMDYDRLWEREEAPAERLRRTADWDEAEAFLLGLFEKLARLTRHVRPTKSSNLFAAAKSHIEKHFDDPDLSVEKVAAGVFVDSSYLRKVFKKESGFSVVDHITHVRMKKAKEWILKGNVKISDIALRAGYSDPNYFSKSFKKRFGMTPSEYEQLKNSPM